jgi:hypothetical protein
MGTRLVPAATGKGLIWIFAALGAFALWALPTAARAADTASAPDGTITIVAGLQYSRLAPSGEQEAWRDYAPRESEEEGGPQIAVAPDGTATVVWIRTDPGDTAVLERRIDPEGELEGGVNELGHSEDPHVYPEVAVAPDGTATVVWTATHEGETAVEASRIAPDGTADPAPTELTTGSSYQPHLGVAPDGTATVVWQQFGEDKAVAEARQISPDGTLGETLKLSSGVGSAQDPAVAVTSKGAAVVVWEDYYWQESGPPDEVLEERRIEANGSLETAVHLLSTESGARAPVLAAGPDGSVTVLWSQSFNHLDERRIEADGTPAESIYNVTSPAVGGIYPKVAVEPSGKALVVWSDGWNIFFRRLGSDGTPLGSPTQILASNGYLNVFGLGLGPKGVATPIWQRRLGYYKVPNDWVMQGVRIHSDDSVGSIFDLTDRGTEAATWASPATGEYGSLVVGSQSTLSFAFNNRSTDPLPVESVELAGPDADQFSIVDTGTCLEEPIPFVQSCTVTVRFQPTSAGPKEAELLLAAEAPRQPGAVPLTGTGVAATSPCCGGQAPSPLTLQLGKPKNLRRPGAAVLPVTASRAGTLQTFVDCAGSQDHSPTSIRLNAGSESLVPARASGPCRRILRREGAVRLKVTLRFDSDEGESAQRSRQLLLRLPHAGS